MSKNNRRRQEPQDTIEDESKDASRAVFCCGMSKCKFFTVLGIVVGVVIVIVVGLKIGHYFGLKNQQKNGSTNSDAVSFYEWPAIAPKKLIPLDQFLGYDCLAVTEVVLDELKRSEVVRLMVDSIRSLKPNEASRYRNYTDPTFVGDQPKTAEEKTVSCMESITTGLASMVPTNPAGAARGKRSRGDSFVDQFGSKLPEIFSGCVLQAFAAGAGAARTGKRLFNWIEARNNAINCLISKSSIAAAGAALNTYGKCITQRQASEGKETASERFSTDFKNSMSIIGAYFGGELGTSISLAMGSIDILDMVSDAIGSELTAMVKKDTCACNADQLQCKSWCECRVGPTVDCWCCIHGKCNYRQKGPSANMAFGMGPITCASVCFITCSTDFVGTTDIGLTSQCSIV